RRNSPWDCVSSSRKASLRESSRDRSGPRCRPWSGGNSSTCIPRRSTTAKEDPEQNHANGQDQMEPVIGIVERHEVSRVVTREEEAVDPENGIDHATPNEVVL